MRQVEWAQGGTAMFYFFVTNENNLKVISERVGSTNEVMIAGVEVIERFHLRTN